MNNKVSIVIVISQTFRFKNWSQYKSQSFRPSAIFAGLRVKDSLSIIILHVRGDHYVSLISLQLSRGI